MLSQTQKSTSLESDTGQSPAVLAVQCPADAERAASLISCDKKIYPASLPCPIASFLFRTPCALQYEQVLWVAQPFSNSGNNIFKLSWTVFCNEMNILAAVQQRALSSARVWLCLQQQAAALQRMNLRATIPVCREGVTLEELWASPVHRRALAPDIH